jgi:hypothetical protein
MSYHRPTAILPTATGPVPTGVIRVLIKRKIVILTNTERELPYLPRSNRLMPHSVWKKSGKLAKLAIVSPAQTVYDFGLMSKNFFSNWAGPPA